MGIRHSRTVGGAGHSHSTCLQKGSSSSVGWLAIAPGCCAIAPQRRKPRGVKRNPTAPMTDVPDYSGGADLNALGIFSDTSPLKLPFARGCTPCRRHNSVRA